MACSLALQDGWNDVIVVGQLGSSFADAIFGFHQHPIKTTVYNAANRVHWTPSESVGGVLISSTPANAAAAMEDLRERNLTGQRRKWIFGVRDDPGTRPLIFRGKDGEKFVLLVPRLSVLAHTCHRKHSVIDSSEAYKAYSLYSTGTGNTCWEFLENESLFPSYPNDFGGRSLRITSLGLYPVRQPPRDANSWKWSGYTFDIVNYFAEFLNFTYTTVQPSAHYYYVVLHNGTVVGVIGDLVSRSADMGAGDLSRTPDREQHVDFTQEILDDFVTFVYRRGIASPGLWTVFAPFSAAVWMCTIATLVFVTLVLGYMQVLRGWLFNRKRKFQSCPKGTLFKFGSVTFQALLRQDNATPKLDAVTRIVLAFWYLECLILCTVYSGRLTAFSVVTLEPALDTLDALVRRHPHVKILVKDGTLPFDVVKEPAYEHIWRQGYISVVPSRTAVDDILSLVQGGQNAWVGEAAFADFKVRTILKDGKDSDLYVARTSLASSYWSIALQKGSPFLDVFNEKIRRLWYYGLISRLKEIYFKETNLAPPNTAMPVTLKEMTATFWIWFLGLNLAAATLVFEMFSTRVWKAKRSITERRKAKCHRHGSKFSDVNVRVTCEK
ncbi:glutamate receptor ionotropic, delta-2-like [Ornithodoros turicata]|uniref:glutamate receptor ionotropic, delta-2-like n=1 Tax=Ornithodoros turicata TaxID=34597 RepID=UPI0031394260